MKNYMPEIFIIYFTLLPTISSAQGIEVQTGASIYTQGYANIEIKNGNFVNNGTYTGGTETMLFSGNTANEISGKSDTKVNNIEITNTGGITTKLNNLAANTLSIAIGSNFCIDTAKSVIVNTTITNNAGVNGLLIKSSSKKPNGTLIFHNDQTDAQRVEATVEMYSKASCLDIVNRKNFQWQFFGIPMRTINAYGILSGSYIRQMHENDYPKHWEQLSNTATLTSFTGYEITQSEAKTIYFTGVLENRDFKMDNLDFSTGATYPGQHLIGNPYVGAIDVKEIIFGTDMTSDIYLYNTGSYNDWTANNTSAISTSNTLPTNDLAGQYTVIPQEMAGQGTILSQIPSMQAFIVKAKTNTGNSSISIPYSAVGTVIKNTTLQKSKSTSETLVVQIDLVGKKYADRMWIAQNSNCSHGFDNGWDGEKFLGSVLAPQIYAIEETGIYQVNSVDDFNNTQLGFNAGEETDYKLIFTYEETAITNNELYLIDDIENTITDISKSGVEYQFSSVPNETNRFRLITSKNVVTSLNKYCNSEFRIYNSGKTIYVKNPSENTGQLSITDLSGKIIQSATFEPYNTTRITSNLRAGVYIIQGKLQQQSIQKTIIL